jgi:F0F1-type ATP synthase assembly protein I
VQEDGNRVGSNDDDRSRIARAWGWSSQLTSIALEMVLPGIVGLWIDRQLGSVMVFLILGVVFGMTAGMIHLVQFARRISEKERQAEKDANE